MEELLIVAGIHILGVASPGPDFALVLKNALSGGRSSGLYTSFGVALGIIVHVAYSVVGLAVIISKSILLFNIIKYIGAAYLIWLGIKALRSKRETQIETEQVLTPELSPWAATKQGFLTNVLNPKATLFFLGLFTQIIEPETSAIWKSIYGLEMTLVTFIWFAIVSVFVTQKPIRNAYQKAKHHIDRVFGAALVALGIKVGLSASSLVLAPLL